MDNELIIGQRSLQEGFEFHYAPAAAPTVSLCGTPVVPTQIQPMFWGVDSAIEGRWCERCESLARKRKAPDPGPEDAGYAPCI